MKHNNPSIAENSVRLFNLKTGEGLPEINDFIVPTIEVKPFITECSTGTLTDATSVTIITTPTDKDLYITSACLSGYTSAISAATQLAISCTINGVGARRILLINKPASTATHFSIANSFNIPFKPDRGTPVVVTSNSASSLVSCQAVIQGYYVETVKGV